MDMQHVIEILKFLRNRFHFWDGLVVLVVAAVGLYEILAQLLGSHVFALAKAMAIPNAEILAHVLYLSGFAIVLLVAVYTWKRFRSVPKFRQNELGIIFAPRFPSDLEEDVTHLLSHLKQELKAHQFGNQFVIKQLPPNLSINSSEEASRFLRESLGTTAVWGLLDSQQSQKGRTTRFSRVSFTFVHQPAAIDPMRVKVMALSMAGRKMHTEDRTLIADRQMMAKDIGVIVRNFIGISLSIDLRWHDAVKVFLPLHAELKTSQGVSGRKIPTGFVKQIGYDLAFALTMATSVEYREFLFERGLASIPPDQCKAWLKNVNQAVRIDPQNSVHFLSKAIYHFLLGNCSEAIRAATKAKKLAPKALATPNFSLAFLHNYSGDFVKSQQEYRLGLAKKTSYDADLIAQCRIFIRQCIDLFPEKKQLRLALAVIEINRGSKDEGIKQLRLMQADPPTGAKFSRFVEEGRKLLNRTESNQ